MHKEFKSAEYNMKEDGEAASHDSCFLIAVRGVIYPIWQDYSWDRDISGIYTMGSGGDLAQGALEVLGVEKVTTADEAEEMVRLAVAAAIKHDIYCSEPIHTFIQRAPVARR
jgi:ATP-dependent protease HslVU (ClpYQ) peptidase subunit